MKGRAPTVEEKEFMDKLAQLGCIVCMNGGYGYTPAAIHHINGKTKPGAHFETLPLCGKHHQEKDSHKQKRWISRHGDGRRAFEEAYGKELDLLEQCEGLLSEVD